MAQYVNNAWAYSQKYDSLQLVKPALDSCWRFLKKFPNSFVKPNVFSYMLEMTVLISHDKKQIYPLIDSVLFYDNLPSTKMRIGELLIEQDIEQKRGMLILESILPELSFPFHRYKTHLLLAKAAMTEGKLAQAKTHIDHAVMVDSTRDEAWYEYLGYFKMLEQPNEVRKASRKIAALQGGRLRQYEDYINNNSNLGKSVYGFSPRDLEGKSIELQQFSKRVMVIQWFNFWCGNPEKEFPTLKNLIKEFPTVKFVFVNAGETPDELKSRYFNKPATRFLKTQTVVFEDSVMINQINGIAMGEILLVDKLGKIRYAFPGMTRKLEGMMKKRLRELLRE